ncbi:MAG: hypothetical protein V1695_03070 [Candidatus Uhrbacteria bacterium]
MAVSMHALFKENQKAVGFVYPMSWWCPRLEEEMPKKVTTAQIRELLALERSIPEGILKHLLVIVGEHGGDTSSCSTTAQGLEQLFALDTSRYKIEQVGLGAEVQNLIARLTSGSLKLSDDIRIRQAKILWDLRFGEMLGLGSQDWKKYLNGTDSLEPIPQIPIWPTIYSAYLNRNILVDKRVLDKVRLKEVCRLLEVSYPGNDNTFEPYEEGRTKSGVYWMRAQDGRRNLGKKPRDCRTQRFAPCEVGLEAFEGLSLFAQDRKVLNGHYMDLPGSVRVRSRGDCAYLGLWSGGPELRWCWDDNPFPACSSASRGE